MSGTTTAAQWACCTGIGVGSWVAVAALAKLAIDGPRPPRPPKPTPAPAAPPAPVRPALPAASDETVPLRTVQPSRARHRKGSPS